MSVSDHILSLIENTPNAIITGIAGRVKQRRLEATLTQKELAKRAGVSLPAYRRFERTGEISLRSLVLLGMALDMTAEFSELFQTKLYGNMDDLLKAKKKRQRGKRDEAN
jgi:transcriptional regulator with XRE-family HTH domain